MSERYPERPGVCPPQAALTAPTCNLAGLDSGAVAEFVRHWNQCGAVIWVAIDSTTAVADTHTIAEAVRGGISTWNTALGLVGQAPRFSFTNNRAIADVFVEMPTPDTDYCGETNTSSLPFKVTVKRKSVSRNCDTNWSVLPRVVTHELGHALGFESSAHAGGALNVSSHCIMELVIPAPGINSGICQHELEKVYAAYGIVPIGPVQDAAFFNLPIITGVNAPASVTLQTGASTAISPTQLLFARGGAQGPVPLGGVQLSWGSSDIRYATVANGVIAGIGAGTLTITITANPSTVPSQYQLGGLFTSSGQAITVTVVDPPLGPGFVVSDIYGVPQPVTATGSYTFQVSTVNGGAPSTLQVDWTIAPSVPVFDTIRTGWGPRTITVYIGGGSFTSYDIRVTARPRNRLTSSDPWVIGGDMIEDFPVCIGGGGQFLMAPEPGPDAVGGC